MKSARIRAVTRDAADTRERCRARNISRIPEDNLAAVFVELKKKVAQYVQSFCNAVTKLQSYRASCISC